jgi:hypothetical protein
MLCSRSPNVEESKLERSPLYHCGGWLQTAAKAADQRRSTRNAMA